MFKRRPSSIRAYLIEFEFRKNGVRYLCASCAGKVIYWWKKRFKIRFITMIHSDVYDKKCHMCKGKG